MYEYIKGTLVTADPVKVTIETNGIGYLILIPLSTFSKLPQIGTSLTLYTSFIVREDAHLLFGFYSKEEKELFELSISISGIGPKTALALIGHLNISELQTAVFSSNLTLLCKVPGIGKKTAERLIIELRDKLKGFEKKGFEFPKLQNSIVTDAISALIHLGYNSHEAQKAISTALKEKEKPENVSSLITLALKKI